MCNELSDAAELFKTLGNQSRLLLLCHLQGGPRSVNSLASATSMSQPLVSQHLRVLRAAGLVTVERSGKHRTYSLADGYVGRLFAHARAHSLENDELKESTMSTHHSVAEHTVADHQHGPDCGHESIQHGDHTDYVHDGHLHALDGDHYDEHGSSPERHAEHTVADHEHGANCGHESVQHGDHTDYLHDGHLHAQHGEHYDEH
nr:metalloregulator ArsR/SmtB family transcription factor [Kocuria massiliensis]